VAAVIGFNHPPALCRLRALGDWLSAFYKENSGSTRVLICIYAVRILRIPLVYTT
jgi:hypothetical protein